MQKNESVAPYETPGSAVRKRNLGLTRREHSGSGCERCCPAILALPSGYGSDALGRGNDAIKPEQRCDRAMATTLSGDGNDAVGRWRRRYRVMATTLSSDGNDAIGRWQRCYPPIPASVSGHINAAIGYGNVAIERWQR
jgi:hypothetical protein